jgi:hypothetical protein
MKDKTLSFHGFQIEFLQLLAAHAHLRFQYPKKPRLEEGQNKFASRLIRRSCRAKRTSLTYVSAVDQD